jgi:hypothetical protein
MGARNRVGIELSYLCSLATQFQTRFLESIPRPIAGLKFPTQATQAGGIDSLESIPGLPKSLKIPSLAATRDVRGRGWGRNGGKGWGSETHRNFERSTFFRCLM